MAIRQYVDGRKLSHVDDIINKEEQEFKWIGNFNLAILILLFKLSGAYPPLKIHSNL